MTTMLDYALAYAAFGWLVFPIFEPVAVNVCSCRKGPSCGKDCGKHPRTPNGVKDASKDPLRVRDWWSQWPRANVAIATGGGLAVLDVDDAQGEAFAEQLPLTFEVKTSKGRHLYFRGDVPNTVKRIAGVDSRGPAGYVLAPTSVHQTGSTYTWTRSPASGAEIVELPQHVVELLSQPPASKPPNADAHGLRVGPDCSRSGLDAVRTIALVQRGLSDEAIRVELEAFSEKWRERSPSGREAYFRSTLEYAKRFHELGLVRVKVVQAALTGEGETSEKPALWRVKLDLVTADGEVLRAKLKVPTDGYPDRRMWDAVETGIDPVALIAPGGHVLAAFLVGRELDVVIRDGRVVWMCTAR